MGIKIYGESSRMTAETIGDDLVFKLKFSTNLIVSLLIGLFFVFLLFAVEIAKANNKYIYVVSVIPGVMISGISFKKYFAFKRELQSMIIAISFLGISKKREVPFRSIASINLKSEKKTMIGVQLPVPIWKHSIEILLANGKSIFIDRSSDFDVMKRRADMISEITGYPIMVNYKPK